MCAATTVVDARSTTVADVTDNSRLAPGDPAPEFTLPDAEACGDVHSIPLLRPHTTNGTPKSHAE